MVLLLSNVPSVAQNPSVHVDEESKNILTYIKHSMRCLRYYPQEKVYLHLDNNGYFKGETIWMKAYVTRCDIDNATDLSHVLYVELLNPTGDVVAKRTLPIVNGEAFGDIKVDSIMTTGFYEVRAYTRYMTNWGTNACFSRIIPIFKTPATEGDYASPVLDKISYRHRLNNERMTMEENDQEDVSAFTSQTFGSSVKVHFYPEGGHAIDGLPCRIAFSVTRKDGTPLESTCKLIDDKGNLFAVLPTDSDGRGIMELSKDSPAKHLVVVTSSNKEITFPLPQLKANGCTMMLDMMNDDHIFMNLFASQDMIGKKIGYMMVHGGTVVRCDTLTTIPHKQISFKRNALPEGVSQITLFDSQGTILAERLFFILHSSSPSPSIQVAQTSSSIKPCGKVSFLLQTMPHSTLSFSAIDAQGMVNGRMGNIKTWMLLGSEVKGFINHPEYYFEADDTIHRQAADKLMLIQGWRRYDTQQTLFDGFQPIEDKLYLLGKVKGRTKNKPIDNVSLTATLYNQYGQVIDGACTTDSLGRYVFSLPDIDDEWNLHLRSQYKNKDENYIIAIDRHFTPKSRYVSEAETQIVLPSQDQLQRWDVVEQNDDYSQSMTERDHVLENVVVKAKRRVWDKTSWGDETDARHFSMIYYDCDADLDCIADEGLPPPRFDSWLKTKNSLFSGNEDAQEVLLMKKNESGLAQPDTVKPIYEWFSPVSLEYNEYERMPPAPWKKFYADGLSYKNRPIVWIIDNMFVTITNYKQKGIAMPIHWVYSDNYANTMDLPVSLADVKCVYISEDSRAMLNHISCGEIEQMTPVVIYCYTHRTFQNAAKGVRVTLFQGFNTPSTFQMENYSQVPPMDDFRRTLYWHPNIKTDAEGKATVEFYNNSSCTEMYLHIEGMTHDWKPVLY